MKDSKIFYNVNTLKTIHHYSVVTSEVSVLSILSRYYHLNLKLEWVEHKATKMVRCLKDLS